MPKRVQMTLKGKIDTVCKYLENECKRHPGITAQAHIINIYYKEKAERKVDEIFAQLLKGRRRCNDDSRLKPKGKE